MVPVTRRSWPLRHGLFLRLGLYLAFLVRAPSAAAGQAQAADALHVRLRANGGIGEANLMLTIESWEEFGLRTRAASE